MRVVGEPGRRLLGGLGLGRLLGTVEPGAAAKDAVLDAGHRQVARVLADAPGALVVRVVGEEAPCVAVIYSPSTVILSAVLFFLFSSGLLGGGAQTLQLADPVLRLDGVGGKEARLWGGGGQGGQLGGVGAEVVEAQGGGGLARVLLAREAVGRVEHLDDGAVNAALQLQRGRVAGHAVVGGGVAVGEQGDQAVGEVGLLGQQLVEILGVRGADGRRYDERFQQRAQLFVGAWLVGRRLLRGQVLVHVGKPEV